MKNRRGGSTQGMFRLVLLAGACLVQTGAVAGPAAPGARLTLEEVIARHVEARGGARAWGAIRSLRITGSMNSWSQEAPFTLLRARDGRYRLDSVQGGRKVVVGYDGATAWWDNRWYQEGALRIRGADLAAFLQEIDYPTPFFDHAAKGHAVRLLGPRRFEGRGTIALEVVRAGGAPETWHLDPETFLETARESSGSDFGIAAPMVTYYEDFRPAAGVRIPFRTESHWNSRERVMTVERVEADVDLDDAVFVMPPLPGMEELKALAGEWDVAASARFHPGAPWRDSRRVSTIEPLLGGTLLQERSTTVLGHETIRSIAFDRLKQAYRVTEITEATGRIDVLEGRLDENGRLVVSNLDTGTAAERSGHTVSERLTIAAIAAGGFTTEKEISTDGGKEWFLAAKATYSRRAR